MLNTKRVDYFGNWSMEVKMQERTGDFSTSRTYQQNLSTVVKTNLTEKVESVNPRLEWELDTADLFVPVPNQVQYVDIM